MTEAYLFAAVEAATAGELIQTCLASARTQASWLNEVHWIGEPPSLLEGRALFTWPESPLLAHFTLDSLLRGLAAGAMDLVVLGQTTPSGATALLLGAPVVVGRWNLPPVARLMPLPGSHVPANALPVTAAACLPEGEAPAFLGLSGLSRAEAQEAFPGARCLDGEASDLHRVWQLLQALERSQSGRALLLGAVETGGLATLIEKL